jgi:hypothetical protein
VVVIFSDQEGHFPSPSFPIRINHLNVFEIVLLTGMLEMVAAHLGLRINRKVTSKIGATNWWRRLSIFLLLMMIIGRFRGWY